MPDTVLSAKYTKPNNISMLFEITISWGRLKLANRISGKTSLYQEDLLLSFNSHVRSSPGSTIGYLSDFGQGLSPKFPHPRMGAKGNELLGCPYSSEMSDELDFELERGARCS